MNDKTTQEQMAERMPAVLTNSAVINVNASVTRIAFFEAFPGQVEPRVAICMDTTAAASLHKALGDLLAKHAQDTFGTAH